MTIADIISTLYEALTEDSKEESEEHIKSAISDLEGIEEEVKNAADELDTALISIREAAKSLEVY